MKSAQAALNNAPSGIKLGLGCKTEGWFITATPVSCSIDEFERWKITINKTINELPNKINSSTLQTPLEREDKEDIVLTDRRRENAAAAYRMAQKQLSHEKGIPEYEEGTLRSEWGTRGDHKKMRARDWGDMQKRRKE